MKQLKQSWNILKLDLYIFCTFKKRVMIGMFRYFFGLKGKLHNNKHKVNNNGNNNNRPLVRLFWSTIFLWNPICLQYEQLHCQMMICHCHWWFVFPHISLTWSITHYWVVAVLYFPHIWLTGLVLLCLCSTELLSKIWLIHSPRSTHSLKANTWFLLHLAEWVVTYFLMFLWTFK